MGGWLIGIVALLFLWDGQRWSY